MDRKVVLGCSVLMVVAVLTVAVGAGLAWSQIRADQSTGTDDEILTLTRELTEELGHEPAVELVCVYPVVGVAPCVPGRSGIREVTLTFTDYRLPPSLDPREHGRRIARFAHERSSFAGESDKTVVVFREGDEWASVTRQYSFVMADLGSSQQP